MKVDVDLLKERGAAAASVHSITDEEIAAGPSFPTAWSRFLSWIETLLNNAVKETEDDSEDEPEDTLTCGGILKLNVESFPYPRPAFSTLMDVIEPLTIGFTLA